METIPLDSDARERLIQAAQTLLWERGFMGTSPAAIQHAAGAGQGSMYHHFKGKEELALAAIQRSADELWLHCEASFSIGGSAYDRIAAYLQAEREILRGCRIGRLTQDPDIMGSAALRAPVDALFARLKARLTDIIEAGRARGEFTFPVDTLSLAEMIVAVVQGGYVVAKAANDTLPFTRALAAVLGLLRSGEKS